LVPSSLIATVEVNAAVPAQLSSPGPNARKVTLPLAGLCSPVSVAASVIVAPMTVDGEALLWIAGAALEMTTSALRPAQALVAGLLLVSPTYSAAQWYVPGAVGVKLAELAVPSSLITIVDMNTGAAVQFVSPGPNRRKITLPEVGLYSLLSTAAASIEPPRSTPADAFDWTDGEALMTSEVEVELLHAATAGSLLASPG